MNQVWEGLDQSYRRMVTYLDTLSDLAFAPGTCTHKQIVTEFLEHYRDHAEGMERAQSSDASKA